MGTMAISDKKTTVKLIVRKKAEIEDLQLDNRFLIPENGGHRVAHLLFPYSLLPPRFSFLVDYRQFVEFTAL